MKHLFLFFVFTTSLIAAEGNLRYSITVEKFKNEAGWHGRWNVGDGFTTMMTNALHQSDNFIVLGDAEMRGAAMAEQDLAATGRMAGGKKAPKMGRMTPAQLLVRGSITHVDNTTAKSSGKVRFKGISLGKSGGKGEVNITMYLVDSETGQVKASTEVIGVSNRSGVSLGYYGSALGGLGGNLAGFEKDNIGKACADAVDKGVEFLVQQLEDVQWEATVIMAGSKTILNRGTREGVRKGDTFIAGEVEELVDPDSGEVLDFSMTIVGELKVTEVKEKVAYCKVVSGAVEKGMTVFPK
jgi:curli biogenesis system outer membrane secretion channel CsgG